MSKPKHSELYNAEIDLSRIENWIGTLMLLQDTLMVELYPTVQSAMCLDYIEQELEYWTMVRKGFSFNNVSNNTN